MYIYVLLIAPENGVWERDYKQSSSIAIARARGAKSRELPRVSPFPLRSPIEGK